MAKKKTEDTINLDSILFKCRDILRAARNSGSFFEKRDMMLTLVFLRFIGEKYEDGIEKLRQILIEQGLDPDDENIRAAFFDDATFADGTYNLPPEARWSTIINTPAPKLNVALDNALHSIAASSKQLKGCFVEGTFTTRNLAPNDIKKLIDEVNKISHKKFGEEKDLIGRVYEYFLKEFAVNATKEEGEFYTPHDVVQLIATMIEPYDGTLYDPCCGSGGMFIQSAALVKSKQGDINRINVYGQEKEPATYRLAKMNLALRGISHTLIDFETPENNIFHVVNQLTVDYINNGQRENRRPDVLLYVNGMPLCIIELKNPADSHSTIYDAWEQITIRYWRDIPHLLHYCPLACISDGVKTRLGTVRTPYEHFYAWRRVNDADKISTMPFAETETMIKGVYAPERFLEIFRDYIYFQDEIFDCDEREIVCRYPQFFAVRLLKQSIIKSVMEQTGKGGTYFGATGCGKTYTMAFLARQLALRCSDIPEIGSPTIVMIVDRDELQEQGIKLFAKSKEFLNLGEVSIVKSRNNLRQELGSRESGGFYICTIQKFCDRKEDKIGLINDRHNIICFSDEAHRTQLEHSRKIQFSKDADENMKAMVSKPYAKVLKEAFPHATFVGFTGTPIAETYQTFGDEIDRYTMDQAVADGFLSSEDYNIAPYGSALDIVCDGLPKRLNVFLLAPWFLCKG